MKKVIALAIGVLCSVTMCEAKGKPAGEELSALCVASAPLADSCVVTANGLAAGRTYRLDVRSNCGDLNSVTFTAIVGNNSVLITAPETDSAVCTTSTFFFYLYLGNKQVATASTPDD